jgi:CO/xanthine dehydrogenase Mo-binding subunit
VAQVAEVELREDELRVVRVVCAVDCGFVLNPDTVIAQMEGGIGFGLSCALHGQITLDEGRVSQNNFHSYRVLNISEMPAVEVHLVDSDADPTGVGEPGSVAIAAAVANAVARLTGQPIRALPLLPLKQSA